MNIGNQKSVVKKIWKQSFKLGRYSNWKMQLMNFENRKFKMVSWKLENEK